MRRDTFDAISSRKRSDRPGEGAPSSEVLSARSLARRRARGERAWRPLASSAGAGRSRAFSSGTVLGAAGSTLSGRAGPTSSRPTSGPSAVTSTMTAPTGTIASSANRCGPSLPATGLSSGISALSVSISATASPSATSSPGCLSHFTRRASDIAIPSDGIVMLAIVVPSFLSARSILAPISSWGRPPGPGRSPVRAY